MPSRTLGFTLVALVKSLVRQSPRPPAATQAHPLLPEVVGDVVVEVPHGPVPRQGRRRDEVARRRELRLEALRVAGRGGEGRVVARLQSVELRGVRGFRVGERGHEGRLGQGADTVPALANDETLTPNLTSVIVILT